MEQNQIRFLTSNAFLIIKFRYNHCYTRPIGGGLFHFINNIADNYTTPSINIRVSCRPYLFVNMQNCEFHNFFYEMSSLVVMPLSNESLSVTVEKNLFSGFSSCGALLSNNIDLSIDFNSKVNPIFAEEEYSYYIEDYLTNNYAYFNGSYSSRNQLKSNYSQSFIIKGNTFTHFNLLKRRTTDLIQERKEQGVARVNGEALKNMGMIIDIYGGENMNIDVIQNTFENIVQHFGTWNGFQYDICSHVLNDSNSSFLSANSSANSYYQLTHLISISKIQNSRVLIGSNNFTNLSTTGPLIFAEESAANNQFIIIQNQFRFIHGYINSNVIQLQRKIHSNSNNELGANILIKANNFSEIAGCPSVLASAIYIGMVRYQQANSQSEALSLPQEQSSNFLKNSAIKQGQIEYVTHQIYGTLSLDKNTLLIENNIFINISMGVARVIDNLQSKGALIKIVNIPQAKISNSTFYNIGAYTVEHSKQLQSQIFGISEGLISSYIKGELFSDANEEFWLSQSQIMKMPFMQTYLSTSLICAHGMKSLNLGDSNKFYNIWLVDRYQSFEHSQIQGILLYLEQFNGEMIFGGNSGVTTIESIIGLLNPFTIERFSYWDLSKFANEDLSARQYPSDELIYGAGSIIFNIHSSTNNFDSIILQNLSFSNIYHRSISCNNTLVPSIISSIASSSVPTIQNISLSGILIVNSTFEKSTGYFQLSASNLSIKNIEVENIGNWNYLADPMRQDWNIEVAQKYALNSSIFLVSLMNEFEEGLLELSNSSFININSNTGALPILQIVARQHKNQTKLIQISDVLIKDCLSNTQEINAPSALFKMTIHGDQKVKVDIHISKIRIQDSQSQCKLQQLSKYIQSVYSASKGVLSQIL
ncbi:hypothetical protein FGO68_gene10379 [Halteria grandinella]|uniref:Uncharacterized protein n=1 Tax=Halteria grandinella TaxID=5974 RepID=A0A8J8TB70_HALGN|nr:hypothetical protein FGO68_gene10379 [Halteria grandinella]